MRGSGTATHIGPSWPRLPIHRDLCPLRCISQAVAFPELTENGQPRGTAGANVLTLDAIKANRRAIVVRMQHPALHKCDRRARSLELS
jgi:hypothetical protein